MSTYLHALTLFTPQLDMKDIYTGLKTGDRLRPSERIESSSLFYSSHCQKYFLSLFKLSSFMLKALRCLTHVTHLNKKDVHESILI
jgi:hypothetical protein